MDSHEPEPSSRTSFVKRVWGAATFSVPVYEEVEHDPSATAQAAGVVGLVAVAAAIGALPSAKVAALERAGQIGVEVSGASHEIRRDEVQVTHTDPAGWILEREGGWSVALDLEIGEDLRLEGFAREVVNKIQYMRRQADFEITDRIEVFFEGTEVLREAIEPRADG